MQRSCRLLAVSFCYQLYKKRSYLWYGLLLFFVNTILNRFHCLCTRYTCTHPDGSKGVATCKNMSKFCAIMLTKYHVRLIAFPSIWLPPSASDLKVYGHLCSKWISVANLEVGICTAKVHFCFDICTFVVHFVTASYCFSHQQITLMTLLFSHGVLYVSHGWRGLHG